MPTYSAFVTEFPEFAGSDSGLVTAKLNAAALEIDASVCGALADQLVYYLAARKLAIMPSGNTSKLINRDGSTVYDEEIARLRRIVVGPIVAP